MKSKYSTLYSLLAIAAVVALWFAVAAYVNVEFLLPSPTQTIQKFVELLKMPIFYRGIISTACHAILSFVIAFIAALLCAIMSSLSRVFERMFYPVTLIIRVAPTMSVIFLSILWMSSENSPYLVCVLVLFPLMYTKIYSAILSIDKNLLEMSSVYNVKKKDVILKLYLPHVAKAIYAECLGYLSFSVKIAVSGEAVSQSGFNIGNLMFAAKANLDTAELLAYTLAAVLLGFALECLLKLLVCFIGRIYRGNARKN